MRRALTGLAIIVAAAAVQASSSQQALKTGTWVIDVRMEIPNLPGGMPPTKAMVCIDETASTKPWLISDGKSGMSKDCQFGDQKVNGNKISATMTCQGGMVKGQFDIEVKPGGEAYTGVAAMTVGPQTMKTFYDGKWQKASCDKQ